MYFQQIISGLDHLHGNGVFHRDIKLENLLLDDELRVKIADFGLSKVAIQCELGKAKSCTGTPNYMAHELV